MRAIVRLGFESIQPFFWQTLGGKDLPRLAGELKEAIGDADVKVSALGMFGNPLEDADLDRQTLKGWETLIDNARLFRRGPGRRLHRADPRREAPRKPAALQGGVGRACAARRRQGRSHRL